jgi:transposase
MIRRPSPARFGGSPTSWEFNPEALRTWVRSAQAEDRGAATAEPGAEQQRIAELERQNRELKRANTILRQASAFFAAELCATRRRVDREVVRDRLPWVVAAA